MQNKANFWKSQMDVKLNISRDYENESAFRFPKNKPKQSQFQETEFRSMTMEMKISRRQFLNSSAAGIAKHNRIVRTNTIISDIRTRKLYQ